MHKHASQGALAAAPFISAPGFPCPVALSTRMQTVGADRKFALGATRAAINPPRLEIAVKRIPE